MTQHEADAIEAMYARHNYRCFLCDNPATQRAHIIGDTKSNRIKYGNVIDNPLNWLPACNLRHNGYIDISRNRLAADTVAAIIMGAWSEKTKRRQIEVIVKENVKRKLKKRLTG